MFIAYYNHKKLMSIKILHTLRKCGENMTDVDELRKMFLNPNVIKPDTVSHNEINKDKLISFMCDQNNFSEERISNMINKLEKTQEERSESLDKWFK